MNPKPTHTEEFHRADSDHADVVTARVLLDDHLELIRAIVSMTARQRGVHGDERDEFEQYVMVKLLDNNLTILRRFRGDSSLKTFLTVVVQRLLLDFRNHRWGRWRPSAKARRLGRLAIQLERLTVRDGRTIADAIAVLSADRSIRASEAQLEALAVQLPTRFRRRHESDDGLETLPAHETADRRVAATERRAHILRLQAALVAALLALPEEDRLLVRLRYLDGFTVPQIARLFEIEAKPLYRHYDRQMRAVRAGLHTDGISWNSVADLIGRPETAIHLDVGT